MDLTPRPTVQYNTGATHARPRQRCPRGHIHNCCGVLMMETAQRPTPSCQPRARARRSRPGLRSSSFLAEERSPRGTDTISDAPPRPPLVVRRHLPRHGLPVPSSTDGDETRLYDPPPRSQRDLVNGDDQITDDRVALILANASRGHVNHGAAPLCCRDCAPSRDTGVLALVSRITMLAFDPHTRRLYPGPVRRPAQRQVPPAGRRGVRGTPRARTRPPAHPPFCM